MDDTHTDELNVFLRMARTFPVRTVIFTFGLPAFAILQVTLGIVYGGSLPVIGLFAAVAVAFSIQLTRWQVATYRRKQVTRQWTGHGQ